MTKNIVKQLVLQAAIKSSAGKHPEIIVTMQTKWKEDLGLNIFELGDVFVYVFKNSGIITDVNKLRELYARDNMTIDELAEFMFLNITGCEKLNKTNDGQRV